MDSSSLLRKKPSSTPTSICIIHVLVAGKLVKEERS
jgi:hypothetical protein